MGYENNLFRNDEEDIGEPPLMDNNINDHHQHLLNHNNIFKDIDRQSNMQEPLTPVFFNESDSINKPRKIIRLIKNSTGLSESDGGKRKRVPGGSSKKRPVKKLTDKGGSKRNNNKKNKRSGRSGGDNAEVKEMWDAILGGNLVEGTVTVDDDNFIDDSGVDPADRYVEEEKDDEINDVFKMCKKKKKVAKSGMETAMLVEKVMAELEVVAEEDADLNRESKPAINKLIKLPFLVQVLSKKPLQLEFLDHGILTTLRKWLEVLPDGSLPNINVRAAILNILTELPIDVEQYDRREQLKNSGIGKAVMFLSNFDEETPSNRKLAKELVYKWSRPLFNISTRFEDMKNLDDDKIPIRRPSMKKPMNKAIGMQFTDFDLDLGEYSQKTKAGNPFHASRSETVPLDFVVRPQSKIDPNEVRARAKQAAHNQQRRLKLNKKLQQLKAQNKKQLQATKLSAEGRRMVKYL